jgi:anhydro-N-acetylmuramic acid kinase
MKDSSLVIGLMSGTSADGISAALVRFEEKQDGEVELELLDHHDIAASLDLRDKVLSACASQAKTREICELNFELGEAFAQAVRTVLDANKGVKVDLIASHGQTVWHQVDEDAPISTLQIAEPAIIAGRTGITTVANFRTADVAAGGQGAPLVSFFDYAFFASPDKTRALQNIGGIGNVTFLPAGKPEQAWAFDTGPGNVLMDMAITGYSQGKLTYDLDGQWAAKGRVIDKLVNWLIERTPYFQQLPPKSTGRELFNYEYLDSAIHLGKMFDPTMKGREMLATLTAFTARSISQSYKDFGPEGGVDEIIVSGGGAKNPTLMRMLAEEFGDSAKVMKHDDFGLPATAKEAVAFAHFGYELMRGRSNQLPACTGAKHHTIMGQIAPGRNFAQVMQKFAPTMGDTNEPKVLKSLKLKGFNRG